MRWIILRSLFLPAVNAFVLVPSGLLAMDAKSFYEVFVKALKSRQTSALEPLVKSNRTAAEGCLRIVEDKRHDETDTQRARADHRIAQELGELLAVTSGRRGCELGQQTLQRARSLATPELAVDVVRRAVRLCPDDPDDSEPGRGRSGAHRVPNRAREKDLR